MNCKCTYPVYIFKLNLMLDVSSSPEVFWSDFFLVYLGHLSMSHSGDLLLLAVVVNIFFSRTTGPILTKFGI